MEFLERGSTTGLTDAELLGIRKVDDAAALNMVNNNDLLALRKAENIKHDNFLKFGNVNGDINSKIGDFFDNNIMNNTHIPILDPYKS